MIAVCVNWIDVNDDLPDDEMLVMVAVLGQSLPEFGWKVGDQWYLSGGHVIKGEVTYWADLPEVPE